MVDMGFNLLAQTKVKTTHERKMSTLDLRKT